MGQKVNPTVFRINSKNIVWDSHYFSNTKSESSYYLYQDLVIREALDKIFGSRGAVLVSCVIKRSSSELRVFIQFYATRAVASKGSLLKRLRIVKFRKKLWKKTKVRKNKTSLLQNNKENLKEKIYARANQNLYARKPALIFLQNTKLEKKLALILVRYTKVLKVTLFFKNIQNNLIFKVMRYGPYKTAAKKLRSYARSKGISYHEGMELFVLLSEKGNNAALLARFIAFKFRFMRRHNSLLTFLKRTLFIFEKIESSKWQGIKIVISGRFNNAPRAKSRIIQCGCLPLQSVNSKIDYHKTSVHTQAGTFGLKVWVSKKEFDKNVFTTEKN